MEFAPQAQFWRFPPLDGTAVSSRPVMLLMLGQQSDASASSHCDPLFADEMMHGDHMEPLDLVE